MQYRTDGFVLRCYRAGDGSALAEATNSSYSHLKTFMPWAVSSQTASEAEELIAGFVDRYAKREDFVVGIFAHDGLLLGGSGYHLRERTFEDRAGETGMWIRQSHAGKGLGTSVLIAMLRWGLTEWPWERIEWRCDVDNVASAAIARKSGMAEEGLLRRCGRKPDGRFRDTLVFAALRGEWSRP